MKKQFSHPRAAVVFLCLALTACGTARRGEPLAGLLPLDDPGLTAGRQVFLAHCHECHPGGESGLGPALNNKPLPGFLIRLQVRQGLGVMPAFSEEEIDDAQLSDLVAYLQALRRQDADPGGR